MQTFVFTLFCLPSIRTIWFMPFRPGQGPSRLGPNCYRYLRATPECSEGSAVLRERTEEGWIREEGPARDGPGGRPLGVLYLSSICWIYFVYIWVYFCNISSIFERSARDLKRPGCSLDASQLYLRELLLNIPRARQCSERERRREAG